jgi:hypothetical protein
MIVESFSHASPAIESCTKEVDVLPICFIDAFCTVLSITAEERQVRNKKKYDI